MSIIGTILSLLFLTSTISATVRLAAPPDVYSAIIYNKQDQAIDCVIDWLLPSENDKENLQQSKFTIEKQQHYFTGDKVSSMGSWEARGVIKKLTWGQFSVCATFNGVTSPTTNYKFFIYSNGIVSGESKTHHDNNC